MPEQGSSGAQDRSQDTRDQRDTAPTPSTPQTIQTESEVLRAVHEPGNEDDPERTHLIPQPTTGEERFVRDDLGALDSEGGHDWTNQVGTVTGPIPPVSSPVGAASDQGEWPLIDSEQHQVWNPSDDAIQGDMMSGGPTIQGAPFAEGTPPGPSNQLAGNDAFLEQGGEGAPNEAYGQGMTRQFAPSGGEPGIEQQEALQSQQYEREGRRAQRGILGTVGDALRGLFGDTKRAAHDDKGEAEGEAHP